MVFSHHSESKVLHWIIKIMPHIEDPIHVFIIYRSLKCLLGKEFLLISTLRRASFPSPEQMQLSLTKPNLTSM